MSKLVWDASSKKYFEAGVSNVALSVYDDSASGTTDNGKYQAPVAWSGCISITDSPEGAETTDLWADNGKYLSMLSAETFKGSISAYDAPVEFDACDGYVKLGTTGMVVGQQKRAMFGLAYITQQGNDADGTDFGRILHIIYGCKASPTEQEHSTINDSPEAQEFSWEYSCTPISASEHGLSTQGVTKDLYHIKVSEKIKQASNGGVTTNAKFANLIEYIWGKDPSTVGGSDGADPAFPLPAKVYSILSAT